MRNFETYDAKLRVETVQRRLIMPNVCTEDKNRNTRPGLGMEEVAADQSLTLAKQGKLADDRGPVLILAKVKQLQDVDEPALVTV